MLPSSTDVSSISCDCFSSRACNRIVFNHVINTQSLRGLSLSLVKSLQPSNQPRLLHCALLVTPAKARDKQLNTKAEVQTVLHRDDWPLPKYEQNISDLACWTTWRLDRILQAFRQLMTFLCFKIFVNFTTSMDHSYFREVRDTSLMVCEAVAPVMTGLKVFLRSSLPTDRVASQKSFSQEELFWLFQRYNSFGKSSYYTVWQTTWLFVRGKSESPNPGCYHCWKAIAAKETRHQVFTAENRQSLQQPRGIFPSRNRVWREIYAESGRGINFTGLVPPQIALEHGLLQSQSYVRINYFIF
jgi:hypothetical protein